MTIILSHNEMASHRRSRHGYPTFISLPMLLLTLPFSLIFATLR